LYLLDTLCIFNLADKNSRVSEPMPITQQLGNGLARRLQREALMTQQNDSAAGPPLGESGLSENTAFRQAVTVAGGELALANAINVPGRVLSWWLNQGQPASYACIRIEDCTGVRCEDLRPDLYWLRIGEEVVGHVVPVDGADRAYVEAHFGASMRSASMKPSAR
jgi:DNA-binding transcriptional regulator YdaS (Cro superfamily)